MTTDLLRLAELCEQASGPDYKINIEIAKAVGWREIEYNEPGEEPGWIWEQPNGNRNVWPNFTASLDAAMTLVPEWPNHGGYRLTRDDEFTPPYRAEIWEHPDAEPGDGWHRGRAKTLPLALCAASLRARSQESNHG